MATKSNKSSSKSSQNTLVFDFIITEELDIEGDPQEFWDEMDGSFHFIRTNLIDEVPVYVEGHGKIKIDDDYVMRYICSSELDVDGFLADFPDKIKAFCESPDSNYYGTMSIRLGQTKGKQDSKSLLNDAEAFTNDKITNIYYITEFDIEKS